VPTLSLDNGGLGSGGNTETLECSISGTGTKVSTVDLRRARSFRSDEPKEKPFLLYANLRSDNRSVSGYLPSDAYWGLAAELKSGSLKYIEARFKKLQRGSGELLSLYFSRASP
jgi:hypothetical protein